MLQNVCNKDGETYVDLFTAEKQIDSFTFCFLVICVSKLLRFEFIH